ncbi:MaoC family dehydratase [Intestinirhabdus alba]|jgi:hypothetical protein|nr:MaoC family dehydratase [Intestinirhabdus alba]
MPLRYTRHDARRWAAFSGDYNPVHFDKAWVKAQGGSALSVHGMRALLDVKHFISPQSAGTPYLKFTARLRRPLWRDADYILWRAGKKNAAATVTAAADELPCLACQLVPASKLTLPATESQHVLESDELATLQALFASLLADARRWHFLDALLFRHLIQDTTLLRQQSIAALLPPCATPGALFQRYPVVQTHQELLFDSRLLAPWQPDASPQALTIDTLTALTVGDLQQGMIVRIAAATRWQNLPIGSAITLKVGPVAA